MPEQPYTEDQHLDRFLTELSGRISNIQETLAEHTNVHTKTLAEVKYTNGKVGEVMKWRERVNGGALVAGIFMSVVVMPILAWSVYTLVRLPETVRNATQQAVQDALIIYETP